MKHSILTFGLAASLFTGCLLEDEGSETNSDIQIVNQGVDDSAHCANLTQEQQAVGDSLVSLANTSMTDALSLMSEEDDWDDMQKHAPTEALDLYNEALEKAPGHCAALFGKSVASMYVLTQNQELNQFIDDFQATIDKYDDEISTSTSVSSVRDIIKLSPEESPQLLLKTSSKLSARDNITTEDFQRVIENVILPEVNGAISRLEVILASDHFEFNVVNDEGTEDEERIQIDKGEIGPFLAGLRILKSYLVTILAHELDFSQNGDYQWMKDLVSIDDESFDNLTPAQTNALDHFTGMFARDAKITSIKEKYAAAYANIPNELLQAMRDVKTGFEYGIEEAQSATNTQEFDPYVVGTHEDADINPADLQTAIDQFQHFEKYFTGEVAITYKKGNKEIKVNFPKAFQRKGNMQQYLPYFKFYPYEQWNDTIGVDTNFTFLTEETSYQKDWYDACFDINDGSENIAKCYSEWDIHPMIAGPYYFTDAAGNKTLDLEEMDGLGSRLQFKGKIIFPDPTFGGVYPSFTNDNIYEYMESLEDIQPYEAFTCEDIYDEDGFWIDENCKVNPLPENPSDLDRLVFVFFSFIF